MLCFILSGRAHECMWGNQWTCSMWTSTSLPFSFREWFPYMQRWNLVWEMSRYHAVLQVQEIEGTGWCPCTKWETGLYLHLFCFSLSSLKFIKTGMFPLAEAKSLLFDSQMKKSGGHQLSRTPKGTCQNLCVPEIHSAYFWCELEKGPVHVVSGWDIHDTSFLEVPPPCCGKAPAH